MITLITIVDMIGFIHIQSLPTRFLELLITQWRYPCSNCIASKTPNEILKYIDQINNSDYNNDSYIYNIA